MVEDRITDGKRIAELLASELSGLETGSLEHVAIVDADRNATPSEDGTQAYRVTDGDGALARVLIYPAHAEIHLERAGAWPEESGSLLQDEGVLHVDSGATVKDALDAIGLVLSTADSE